MTLPARLHGKDVRLYCNGVDISGDTRAITPKSEIELADITTEGSAGHRFWPGLTKDELTYEVLLNGNTATASTQLTTLFNTPTTEYGLMIVQSGATQAVSDPVWAVNAIMLNKFDIKGVVTDVLWVTADFKTDNYPFDPCILLLTKVQKTTSGTGTIVDNSASSSNGGVGYVQVFEQSGGTGCTLSINHSSDNFVSDDTQLLTFGNWAANGALRVAVTGTVKEYIRAVWAFAGGGPYTATAAISFKRN